ncbi:hypothetical protein JOC24_000273 [Streptomyces sp. HB132]|nr:hypothetical protein [Streptomyces sp. HB132]
MPTGTGPTRIFTLDQRGFRAVTPLTPGLTAFRILPVDG